jgi:hypothetical protein
MVLFELHVMFVVATHGRTPAGAAERGELPWSNRTSSGVPECSSNLSALHVCGGT